MRIPLFAGVVLLSALCVAPSVGCSADTEPYPGALMLAVQTDLVAPKDVSAVGLFISSDGRPIFSDTRDTAPNGEVRFPATIAVIADASKPGAVIKARAVAFTRDGKVRVLRDAITTVPRGRTSLLRLPLLWINEGSGTGTRNDTLAGTSVRLLDQSLDTLSNLHSTCTDPSQTYIDGTCQSANVDSATLPEYAEAAVFGGGHADGSGGACYDVKACFASAVALSVDASCATTLESAGDAQWSFGVALKEAPSGADASTGECLGNGICVVPLEKDTWTISGNRVQFPAAICKRVQGGAALGLIASRACGAKTSAMPSCGPASAVSADHAVEPDGGPSEAGTIDFDAGDDAGADATDDAGGDATVGDAAPPQDGATTVDSGSAGDAGSLPDAAGPPDASPPPDAGPPADASTGLDSGAAPPPFGPPIDYTIGEPSTMQLHADTQRLYVARPLSGPLEANVVSFALSDLYANPSNAAFPRILHFNATDSVGSQAPYFDIAYSGNPTVMYAAFQQTPPWKSMVCQMQPNGAGCTSSGPVAQDTSSSFDVRAVASTPSRVYVANSAVPTIDYYDYGTNQWSSFAIATTYQVTAIHFMRATSTLIVGLASGEIYRCPDSPCSATNGAYYSIAPTGGQVAAIADDGAAMVWSTVNVGVFKEDAVAPIKLISGPLVDATTTSVAVDANYVYAPSGATLFAAQVDGSMANTPLVIATAPTPIASVTSATDHVFYSANATTVTGVCKRFVNAGCQ